MNQTLWGAENRESESFLPLNDLNSTQDLMMRFPQKREIKEAEKSEERERERDIQTDERRAEGN